MDCEGRFALALIDRGLLRPIAGGSNGDPEPTPAPDDAPEPDPAREPAPDAPAEPESFIDPASLPPELKAHWSRMHGAYTKALNRTKGSADKAALVERFWADPAFARQTIEQWAQQTGTPLSFGAGTASPTLTTHPTGTLPAELVSAIEAELPAELRWMARSLAASQWKAQAHLLAPFIRDSQQKEASAREAEYDTHAAQLSETAPGWEAHEDDMSDLLDFLQSKALQHRRWGSKLQVLHALVTGNATATREAVRRIGDAARNRVSTGGPGRSTTTNIADRVRQAKSDHEAFEIAAQHAVEELRRSGGAPR